MAQIDWHFPRTELAENVLMQFATGITAALTLFAPRRMGKTEFLLYDLAPIAEQQGYRVIYCSFWELREDPVKSLLLAIEDSQQSWVERLRRFGRSSAADIEVGIGTDGLKLSAKSSLNRPKPNINDLEQLARGLNNLAQQQTSTLLLLDEVQHLATDKAFEPLVSLLRTVFDKHNQYLQVIYTGSSRDGLQRLFRQRNAPLFHSAQQIDLPKLGAAFVQHMLNAFQKASGRQLSFAEAQAFFQKIHAVPYLFHTLLKQLLISGEEFKPGSERFLDELAHDSEYALFWQELSPLDQAILQWLAISKAGIYTESARSFLAEKLGIDNIRHHSIQNAVNRLRDQGVLASISHGVLVFEEAQFLDWVLEALDH